MSKIINCELIDEQPAFHKEVKLEDGTVFAKIHALTRDDEAQAYEKSGSNLFKWSLWNIYYSLVGHDAEWYLDKELSYETISKLPDKFFNPLRDAVLSLKRQNEITEGTEKN